MFTAMRQGPREMQSWRTEHRPAPTSNVPHTGLPKEPRLADTYVSMNRLSYRPCKCIISLTKTTRLQIQRNLKVLVFVRILIHPVVLPCITKKRNTPCKTTFWCHC